MAKVTVGRHYKELVRRLVASGRFASADDVYREGLRLVEEREEARLAKLDALRQLIAEGDAGGSMATIESAAELIAEARLTQAQAARKA